MARLAPSNWEAGVVPENTTGAYFLNHSCIDLDPGGLSLPHSLAGKSPGDMSAGKPAYAPEEQLVDPQEERRRNRAEMLDGWSVEVIDFTLK